MGSEWDQAEVERDDGEGARQAFHPFRSNFVSLKTEQFEKRFWARPRRCGSEYVRPRAEGEYCIHDMKMEHWFLGCGSREQVA